MVCICGQNSEKDQRSITCNNCQRLIHLECANLQVHQAEETYIFYCQICRPYTGPSILKMITNSHRHNRNAENAENLPIQTGTPDFISYLKKCTSIMDAKPNDVKKMRGQQLTLKDLILSGFNKPIFVETKNGLEMSIDQEFNINNAQMYYTGEQLVDAIEVTRQIIVQAKFEYLIALFKLNHEERQDIYSFRVNISKHFKDEHFHPPRIVQRLSWVDMYWPDVPFKPLLSKYCFFSMKNAFNDFHIDIGGASAWMHVIQGEQIFYLIEPTDNNLSQFEKWIKSDNLHEIMFCKNVENIFKIKVSQGQTIFIPNGWIYSVLSTQDSIAFGGYFLHSLNIETQLSINDFLKSLNKPELDFPTYELTNWYAAPNILKLAKESLKNHPPKHLSKGIEALIDKLRLWLHKSKSKRNENQILVPKAVNCSKIIRDLSRCLRKKKKTSKEHKDNIKMKTNKDKTDSNEPTQTLTLKPEETKIKDLVDSESSNLKIKFNMKLAQDVIRRSMDDPYDLNSDQNGKELLLLDSKGSLFKTKKKKHHDEDEQIAKMVEGRRQDDDYIYLDLETPEENRKAIQASNDKIWQPGTSGNNKQQKKHKSSTSSSSTLSKTPKEKKIEKQQSMDTTATPALSSATNPDPQFNVDKPKKYKKGLATPKQRLAKKLKMSM